jgi:DNA-binding NarL/FixJ family response regulator
MASMGIRVPVVLVDDHALYRRAAASLIESEDDFEIAGKADSGESALALLARLGRALVLIGINMPGIGGIEAARRIAERHPGVPVVLTW